LRLEKFSDFSAILLLESSSIFQASYVLVRNQKSSICFHNRLAYSRTSYKWNHTICVLFVRLLSFSMFLRFIYDINVINNLFLFCFWSVFVCINIPQFAYPFSFLVNTWAVFSFWQEWKQLFF
jgi:hypothetical protein